MLFALTLIKDQKNLSRMLSKKNLDELNQSSREYYERALMKMNLSLVFAAFAFMFLGFCCMAGTRSAVANIRDGQRKLR